MEVHYTYVFRKSDKVLNEHRTIVVQGPTPMEAAIIALSREVMLPYNPYAFRNDVSDASAQDYIRTINRVLGEENS
jgi:hypothetical protein